ncbi:MAG TPA: glycosyltransferase family 4 protein, partial [Anaerovoracaceae bacterium]|nr:glycosyltransferase family 4 protein [Anaerovoracaceae bacterium]
ASKAVKCKAAFDLHAIGIFEIIELGSGYGNRIERLKMSVRNLFYAAQGDLILTCTPNLYWLVKLFVNHEKVIDVTGMVDLNLFATDDIKKNSFNDHKPRVFYIGNYYKWQGVELFLNAIEHVIQKTDRFEFYILGSLGKEQASKVINHPMIKQGKVKLLERVAHDQVPEYMQSADILVIPRPWMLSSYFGFPSKLCEYMASGKFIIATDISPHRWALKHPECGLLCFPSSKGLAEAIFRYDPDKAVVLAEAARKKARECFDYIKQCSIIYRAFEAN